MNNTTDLSTWINDLRERMDQADSSQLLELSEEARSLLKEAYDTELYEEARDLFRKIRRRVESDEVSNDKNSENIVNQIHQESLIIEGGSIGEVENAVRRLKQILNNLSNENQDLIQKVLKSLDLAANRNAHIRELVISILKADTIKSKSGVNELRIELEKDNNGSRNEKNNDIYQKEQQIRSRTDDEKYVNERLAEARRLFYAGDYHQAIDIYSEILQIDEDNKEAKTRLARAEDNILRGVVPDNKVPFDARMAFGKAQSLERAGRYDEARQSYEKALEDARKGGPELANWAPPMEALLRIEEYAVAHETRDEADEFMKEDKWDEAIDKYQRVLKLIPDDSHSKRRLDLLKNIQTQVSNVSGKLSFLTGDSIEKGKKVTELLHDVEILRHELPESLRLREISSQIRSKGGELKNRMIERSKQLISQAEIVSTLIEKKRIVDEASQLLNYSLELDADDKEIYNLLQLVSEEQAELEEAIQSLNEAKKLVGSSIESDRRQAKALLSELTAYSRDRTYIQLVTLLRQQYLSAIQKKLQQNQVEEADSLLSTVHKEPFSLLGQSDEAWRLEQKIKQKRNRKLLTRIAYGFAGFVGFAILLVVTRSFWLPVIVPSRNETPTYTITPTYTPSKTLTPTRTLTPTATITPTATSQPGFGAIKNDTYARISPASGSAIVFYINATEAVEIIEQSRDADGKLWLHVKITSGDSELTGWVLGNQVNILSTPTP